MVWFHNGVKLIIYYTKEIYMEIKPESNMKLISQPPKVYKDHKVIIDNRKKIMLTGITKAISANPTSVILELQNGRIFITGSELHISKLDVESGNVDLDGEISNIKYSGNGQSLSFFKRLFK